MADYPGDIYTPRDIENRSGVVYDPLKKTVVFAEDKQKSDAEIVAIETELGLNPKGSYESVAAALLDLISKAADIVALQKAASFQHIFARVYNQGYNRHFDIDADGNIYVVGNVAYNKVYYYLTVYKSTDHGKSWAQVGTPFGSRTGAGNTNSYNNYYVLKVAPNGNIGVIYKGYSDAVTGAYNIYFAFWDAEAETWTVEAVSSEASYSCGNYFDLAVDSNSDFHVVWTQKRTGSTTYEALRYRKRAAGSWGSIIEVSDVPNAANYKQPCIVIDSNGVPRIVARSGYTGTYICLYVFNGVSFDKYAHTTWGTPFQIAIDSQNNIYCGTDNDIQKVNAAGAWSTITGSGTTSHVQLAVDSSDAVYFLSYSLNSDLSPDVPGGLVNKYNGSWSSGQALAGSSYYGVLVWIFSKVYSAPKALLVNPKFQSFQLVSLTG